MRPSARGTLRGGNEAAGSSVCELQGRSRAARTLGFVLPSLGRWALSCRRSGSVAVCRRPRRVVRGILWFVSSARPERLRRRLRLLCVPSGTGHRVRRPPWANSRPFASGGRSVRSGFSHGPRTPRINLRLFFHGLPGFPAPRRGEDGLVALATASGCRWPSRDCLRSHRGIPQGF